MNATERHRLSNHAADCARSIDRLLPEIFDYDRRKGFSRRHFRLYERNAELWKDLGEEWESNALGMLAAASVMGSRQNAAGFVRSAADMLAPRELELARTWRTTPWHYAVYRVESDLGEELVEIEELEIDRAGQPRFDEGSILFSQSSARQYREGRSLFFSLLWWNGRCYQTYGPVMSFASFVPEDFLFFVREIAAGRSPRGKGRLQAQPVASFSRAIATDPVPFLGLFRFSETPGVRSREAPMVYCNGWASLGDIGFDRIAGAAQASGVPVASVARAQGVGRILFGEGSPMYDPAAYYAAESRRLHLVAMSEAAYARGREALAGVADLPDVPQRRCTLAMYIASQKILGGTSEVALLEEACAELDEGPGPEETADEVETGPLPTEEQAKAILDRLMRNQNEGREESDSAIASSLGVDPLVVANLRGQVADLLERMERNAPKVDRLGLSPDDFAALMKRGLPDREGVLRLRGLEEYARNEGVNEIVAASPLVACARWLLQKLVGSGGARATQAGYLPPALVKEAYESPLFRTPEEMIGGFEDLRASMGGPRGETDWAYLRELRRVLEALGLISLERGRFRATLRGRALADEPLRLHRLLTEELLATLEWRMRREELPSLAPLQAAAGFLLYAAGTLTTAAGPSDWVATERLTEVFLGAVPHLRGGEAFEDPERVAREEPVVDRFFLIDLILYLRFVQFFAVGLGLLRVRLMRTGDREPSFKTEFRTSELFAMLFGQ